MVSSGIANANPLVCRSYLFLKYAETSEQYNITDCIVQMVEMIK